MGTTKKFDGACFRDFQDLNRWFDDVGETRKMNSRPWRMCDVRPATYGRRLRKFRIFDSLDYIIMFLKIFGEPEFFC
jgi:hypothetical protein